MCALQATLKTLPNLFNTKRDYKSDSYAFDRKSTVAEFWPIFEDQQQIKQIGLCKLFNPHELLSSSYYQTTLIREVVNLGQIRHPAIIQFEGFNMYNSQMLFKYGGNFGKNDDDYDDGYDDGYGDGYDDDAPPPPDKIDDPNSPIPTSPTIFLEAVERTPNCTKLLNNFCKPTIGPKKLPWNATKAFISIIGLTHAVYYLHYNGIIHRNISPDVIHFDDNYYPKILDFSTSRQTAKTTQDDKERNDLTIITTNNAAYQAYELLSSQTKDYESSIDVFSLGRLIYAFLAKCHPFMHGDDPKKYPMAKLSIILSGSYPEPSLACIPEAYHQILKSCWNTNPSSRPTARAIYDTIVSNLDIYKTIYPNDEVDMAEVNQYIQLLNASETTLPIAIHYDENAEYNIHKPEQAIVHTTEAIPTSTDEMITQLRNYINEEFIDILDHERPLRLFNALISGSSDVNYPIDVTTAFFNSEYFNKALHSKNPISLSIIDRFFGKEGESQKDRYIRRIRVPSTTEKIDAKDFYEYACEFIYIPESVKIIGDRAFAKCSKLQYVFIPRYGELSQIGEGAFTDCTSLFSFSFPDKVKTVPPHAFENDGELTGIDFNQIEDIEPYGFAQCKKITKLEFPPTLKSIKEHAFKKLPTKNIHFAKKLNSNSTVTLARNAFPPFAFFGH